MCDSDVYCVTQVHWSLLTALPIFLSAKIVCNYRNSQCLLPVFVVSTNLIQQVYETDVQQCKLVKLWGKRGSWTYSCCQAAADCVWSKHTSPRGKCPWSGTCTSSRRPLSSRRTSQRSRPPSPLQWWRGRSGKGSSCQPPPASCPNWSGSEKALEVPVQR